MLKREQVCILAAAQSCDSDSKEVRIITVSANKNMIFITHKNLGIPIT